MTDDTHTTQQHTYISHLLHLYIMKKCVTSFSGQRSKNWIVTKMRGGDRNRKRSRYQKRGNRRNFSKKRRTHNDSKFERKSVQNGPEMTENEAGIRSFVNVRIQ